MDPAKQWLQQLRAQKAAEALAANGFDAVYVTNREAAKAAILERIPSGAKVGFGNSMTLQEIGLVPALQTAGFELINPPNQKLPDSKAERNALRHQAAQADVCLASAGAVTQHGEIVSTDSTGTRLVLYLFGPRQTVLVVGANKVVADLDEAHRRIHQVAAPMNAMRLGKRTPCAATGICDDNACISSDRVCNATIILHKKPGGIERFSVILVGEELGY